VHLEDGSIEHLAFNPNLLCLVGVAASSGRAHLWWIDEEGHLITVPHPEDEPAFVDGLPKHVFHHEIVHWMLFFMGSLTDW